MYRHVTEIAKAVSGPVVLYNVPGRHIVDLSVDTLLRIADTCPNVVGIKDASGNCYFVQELQSKARGRLVNLCGDDPLALPMMALGAKGVISVTSNVYPRQVSEVVADALAGRWAEAERKSTALFPVHRALFCEPSPTPTKAALAFKGMMNAAVRLPIVEATESCQATVASAMKTYEAL
jgi:4-hydroxy-tetrahydrodipicolinate synthase